MRPKSYTITDVYKHTPKEVTKGDFKTFKNVVEDINREMLDILKEGEEIKMPFFGTLRIYTSRPKKLPVDWEATKKYWEELKAEGKMPEKKPVIRLKNRETLGRYVGLELSRTRVSKFGFIANMYKPKFIRTQARGELKEFFRTTDLTRFKRYQNV